MKKLLVCFAVLALLLVPAMAMATPAEQEHWEWDGTQWVNFSAGDSASLARCWTSGPEDSGSCNQAKWETTITNHASVAQWCDWRILDTNWIWKVLKPGDYAANCISAKLYSNGNVKISFRDFANLTWVDDQELEGVRHEIKTWYSFTGPGHADWKGDWYAAKPDEGEKGINDQEAIVPDSQALHDGITYKLYNRIKVVNCNSVGEYENTGTIIISLMNQQDWVDESGHWADLPTTP